MIIRKISFLGILAVLAQQLLCATPFEEQFKEVGYVEICDRKPPAQTFDSLYASFDALIDFLQKHPIWAQKLYSAKERFIRSKERQDYSTEVFGFYDESAKDGRRQISFYYSTHFHQWVLSHYPQLGQIPQVTEFFEACSEIQQPYADLFNEIAAELGLEAIFASSCGLPPILFKVIKYLPNYMCARPHYDGTAFSLFLDSTDNESLLLSPYKASFTVDDFSSPKRGCDGERSILLIPGALLTEYSIYPTPHIVLPSGQTRYATVAFAMRPHYQAQKAQFSPLPNFRN